MLASFLQIVGQNTRYCVIRNTFGRSQFATSENFHKILKALNSLAPDLMVRPGSTVPAKIRESTRFYPYFKSSSSSSVLPNYEDNDHEPIVQTQEQEREDANIWRTNIGSDMWRNANN
ncbi:hypothetical protein JHK85_034158 [Glycine max]|nr:hypothetical protein JHK85_034158 [Glycine max]KAG4985837.1 hypothetical protein JHK86_033528 [Glycine max]